MAQPGQRGSLARRSVGQMLLAAAADRLLCYYRAMPGYGQCWVGGDGRRRRVCAGWQRVALDKENGMAEQILRLYTRPG